MMEVCTSNATRKRTGNIRSNLHTGQNAGSVSPDHSKGQTLVEPLALPGVTRHTNKFLCEATQKRGGRLTIHTSCLNFNGFKVVIALEVMVFLAFCSLSLRNRKTCLSGSVFVVAPSKSVHNCCLHPILDIGLCTRGPKSIHPASCHLSGRQAPR